MSPQTLTYLDRHMPISKFAPTVLEVGSMDVVGGSARKWMEQRGYKYTGADIENGPNVDVVVSKSCVWDLGKKFDAIISVNCFEHCDAPWTLLTTMGSHLRDHGTIIVSAPFSFPLHRHPVDTFRYAPDGFAALAKHAGLRVTTSYITYQSSATYGALSDICWLALRRRWKEAWSKIPEWFGRPTYWDCVAVMTRP